MAQASDGSFLSRDLSPLESATGFERFVCDTLLPYGTLPAQAWVTLAFLLKVGNNVTIQINYQADVQDGLIRADCSNQNIVVTLPPIASVFVGYTVIVKRIDNNLGNFLRITGDANIDGQASQFIPIQNQTIACRSNVTNWDIV